MSHRYQDYLAALLVEMLNEKENYRPSLDEIIVKTEMFSKTSGKVGLLQPL